MQVSILALALVLPPAHTSNAIPILMGFISFVIHLSEIASYNYISKSTRVSPDNLQQPPRPHACHKRTCWRAHLRIHQNPKFPKQSWHRDKTSRGHMSNRMLLVCVWVFVCSGYKKGRA